MRFFHKILLTVSAILFLMAAVQAGRCHHYQDGMTDSGFVLVFCALAMREQ